jgi:RNA polymerase sigma factor (sigma-70 family)
MVVPIRANLGTRVPRCRADLEEPRPVRARPDARPWEVGVVPRAGDPLRVLFEAQYASMVRLATVVLGHNAAAEDVVQQAFVSMDRVLPGLPEGAEVAYLRKVVLNGCRSEVRAGQARKRRPVRLREGEPPAPEEEAVRDDQHRRVLAAIDRLPLRQRQCVILRYYAGLHDPEIAATLDLSVGSAKTHLRRGLKALHDQLGVLR